MASDRDTPRILIVEDDAGLRTALDHFFTDAGYEVGLANDGVEAIEWLEGNVPCAVVLDLLMPGIVGNELLEHMKSEPQLANIPIAIVSGSPQLAPDGYPVFPKPVDLPALLAFARTACGPGSSRKR